MHDTGVSFTYAHVDIWSGGIEEELSKGLYRSVRHQWQGKCMNNDNIINKVNFTNFWRKDKS